MKIHVTDLMIEVTRRCNMVCPHCLRGNAQKKDINLQHVRTMFSKISYISCLTLSGGEPSLVPDIINDILDIAKEEDVEIGNFYLCTNAKKITNEFMMTLMRLWMTCTENEISMVQWSNEQFHDNSNIFQGTKLLKVLKFASPKYGDEELKDVDEKYLLNEGRAIDNFNAGKSAASKSEYKINPWNGNTTIDGELYLNCKGNLIMGCDFSYKNQDKDENILCHVDNFSIDVFKEKEELVIS